MRRLPILVFWIVLAAFVALAFNHMMRQDEATRCHQGYQQFCRV